MFYGFVFSHSGRGTDCPLGVRPRGTQHAGDLIWITLTKCCLMNMSKDFVIFDRSRIRSKHREIKKLKVEKVSMYRHKCCICYVDKSELHLKLILPIITILIRVLLQVVINNPSIDKPCTLDYSENYFTHYTIIICMCQISIISIEIWKRKLSLSPGGNLHQYLSHFIP